MSTPSPQDPLQLLFVVLEDLQVFNVSIVLVYLGEELFPTLFTLCTREQYVSGQFSASAVGWKRVNEVSSVVACTVLMVYDTVISLSECVPPHFVT